MRASIHHVLLTISTTLLQEKMPMSEYLCEKCSNFLPLVNNGLCETCNDDWIHQGERSEEPSRFSHSETLDENTVYAITIDGRAYLILWFDPEDMTEEEARAVAMPMTEKFPQDTRYIPVEYRDAWGGDTEE